MKSDQPITKEYFVKRLAELCLRSGMIDFPKNETDQHILLKSAVLTLGGTGTFTEKEVTTRLEFWVKDVGRIKNVDRVTLRRKLVDSSYLVRSPDGASYQVAKPGPRPELFDDAVDQVDVPGAIRAARDEMERRKREYLDKSK